MSEDAELKEKILRALTRKLTLEKDFDYTDLARRCPSHTTGADLYALCSSATVGALRREIERLEEKGKVIRLAHIYIPPALFHFSTYHNASYVLLLLEPE